MALFRKHYNEAEIRLYLDGHLEGKSQGALGRHLEACRDCFTLYMEMREVDYLLKIGQPASLSLRQNVRNMAKQATGNLVRVRFKVLKDKFILMRGDSENLEFQGVRAAFAYRGKTEGGPVSFSQKIGKRFVTLTLLPIAKTKHYQLAVELKKSENLSVRLMVTGNTIEAIADIRKQGKFLSVIERGKEADLVFEKNNKEVFTINLEIN